MKLNVDFLVLGSGIAGLSYALKVAAHGSVAIVTKRSLLEAATRYAQGGIAAVTIPNEESFASHVQDTLVAGAGLCHEQVVRHVVEQGPEVVRFLVETGVRFSSNAEGSFDLTREGGHSQRRILHAKDATGLVIAQALVAAVQAHPKIAIFEQHIAVDLVTDQKIQQLPAGARSTCLGAYVLDIANQGVKTMRARITLLATGGSGKVYLYTSNPDTASGDGVAMAHRAGCRVSGMEFFQFHPTCLYHPQAKSFLISEAVRGEGGILRLEDGTPFMERYHALKDLAPRDIVARAIDEEMKRTGADCVYLDARSIGAEHLVERFPTIVERCRKYGVDPALEPIPVVPAAHYTCGGVVTNLRAETDLQNLYAAGEVTWTGLHGANRLASNSLLEGAVFASIAAREGVKRLEEANFDASCEIPAWSSTGTTSDDEHLMISATWHEIRWAMWNFVGIVRSDKRLDRALRRIENLTHEIHEYYWGRQITSEVVELRNLAHIALLTIRAAQLRRESRGLHYTVDYPEQDASWIRDIYL